MNLDFHLVLSNKEPRYAMCIKQVSLAVYTAYKHARKESRMAGMRYEWIYRNRVVAEAWVRNGPGWWYRIE